MTEEQAIRVNFGKPMAVFPLEQAVLLPQQVLPLHIFEPRYRQMVNHALDGAGQIAVAVFEGDGWKTDYAGVPPIRPAVCIGQIVQHQTLPDGRYNILLQGVCRARVVEELPPELTEEELATGLDLGALLGEHEGRAESGEATGEGPGDADGGPRLYRQAMLEPVGAPPADPEEADDLRGYVEKLLADGPLSRLAVADQILENVRNDAIPSDALIELVAFALLTDPALRYRLLEETDTTRRLEQIRTALHDLGRLIRRASAQRPERWPKGMAWN